jgi:hypothetical protein
VLTLVNMCAAWQIKAFMEFAALGALHIAQKVEGSPEEDIEELHLKFMVRG